MGCYGGGSAKRHKGWCNNVWFAKLDLGPVKRDDLPQGPDKLKTVKKYISKSTGKPAYCGTQQLKKTQPGT